MLIPLMPIVVSEFSSSETTSDYGRLHEIRLGCVYEFWIELSLSIITVAELIQVESCKKYME